MGDNQMGTPGNSKEKQAIAIRTGQSGSPNFVAADALVLPQPNDKGHIARQYVLLSPAAVTAIEAQERGHAPAGRAP